MLALSQVAQVWDAPMQVGLRAPPPLDMLLVFAAEDSSSAVRGAQAAAEAGYLRCGWTWGGWVTSGAGSLGGDCLL